MAEVQGAGFEIPDPPEYDVPDMEAPQWVEDQIESGIDAGAVVAPGTTPAPDIVEPTSPSDQMAEFLADFNAPEITIDTDPNSPTYLQAWDYSDPDNPVMIADYSNLGSQLEELQNMTVPQLSEWMAAEGLEFGSIDELQGLMSSLVEDIGVISEEERQEALDYAASAFGLDSAEYTALLEELTTQLGDTSTIEGFSDEQWAAYERATARDVANQAEYANRMVNNIMAATGSATRALSAADNYTNNINDYAIQSRTQLIEDDLAAQQANIQSKQQFWNSMVTTGQMAQSEYINQMMQAQSTALQGYAAQMQSVLDENAQYLSMYQSDLSALQLAMDTTYKGIMTELGVNEALTASAQQFFDNYITDFNAQADALMGQLSLAEAELEEEGEAASATGSWILGALAIAGGAVVSLFATPAAGAPIIAAGVGAIASA